MHSSTPRRRSSARDIAIFAALSALMYVSYVITQSIPNVHLLGVFIGAVTLTYRVRALIPIYVYVLLSGIFGGFSFWWMPYLYIWLPLWGAFMLAGRFISTRKKPLPTPVVMGIYMTICLFHGLAFGIMYAPAQALFFGLSFNATLAWVAAGLMFDVIHGVSGFFLAALILPLSQLLAKLSK